jgi:hypothetical protein
MWKIFITFHNTDHESKSSNEPKQDPKQNNEQPKFLRIAAAEHTHSLKNFENEEK